MERQLREGGGIMEVVPREEAFLGGIKKAIKKVSKAVKNVAKSPIGKAAMLYFGGNLLQGNKLLGGNPFTGRITDFITKGSEGILGLAKGKELTGAQKAMNALKVGGMTAGITGLLAAVEQGDEDAIQATTNVDSLRKYLRSSYLNLGYDPERDDIDALVERDVSEYTKDTARGNYFVGGRVKYQQGSGIGTLQGGSQTTPETGKASYAQGPQLYKDLIDYLQIEGPKPEMVNSEMMMNDMGGGPGLSGGLMGPSGPVTESSITSGSTGGGSPGPASPRVKPTGGPGAPTPSNVAPKKPVITSMYWNPALGGSFATSSLASEEDRLKEIEYLQHKDTEIYGSDEKKKKFLDAKLYEKDIEDIKAYLADLYKYNEGGRVGYAEGTKENLIIPKKPKFQTEEEVNATTLGRAEIDDPMPGRLESAKRLKGVMQLYDRLKKMAQSGEMSNKEEAMALFNKRMREESENLHFLDKEKLQDYIRKNRAYGGRMEYAMGSPEDNARKAAGIMDLPLNENKAGVTELDLRETGGFIPPVGVKEKADDIPAMLSNNEFVFTADAVRGMGNGDVNLGAQRMYDMMKKLENGGRV